MSDKDPVGSEAQKALWARLKVGAAMPAAASLPPVADAELAAWLDGRLEPQAAARVEARLAADPALLDAALDVAGALREAGEPAPDRLVTRAQALVGFEAEREHRSRGGLSGWLAGWRRSLELAAVAGAFLVVCATGFSLGGGFQEAYADDSFDVAYYVTSPLDSGVSGFLVEQGDQQ